MTLAEAYELEADLEMFCTLQESDLHLQPGTVRLSHWELGFGPVGGTHPIWGLYRFKGAERVAAERELLWRTQPSRVELFRWCARYVDDGLADELVEAIGTLDTFYERYFAARPDYAMEHQVSTNFVPHVAPHTTAVIHAPTALQASLAQQRYTEGAEPAR